MQQVHDEERELTREVAQTVEQGLPGVEVLAVELSGRERFTVYIDHPAGVDHALCERVTNLLRGYLDRYTVDVSSPGIERPLRTPAHFRNAVGRKVAVRTDRRASAAGRSSAAQVAAAERPDLDPRRRRTGEARESSRTPRSCGATSSTKGNEPGRAVTEMSREIIEAVRTIEREKGIEEDTLIHALEDALLAAYKKTPGIVPARDRRARPGKRRLPRLLDRAAAGHRGAPDRRGPRAGDHRARGAGAGDRRALARARLRRRPPDRLVGRRPCARPPRRRHAGELRPHRRADGEAGDPPADPRGGARDDVRGVHRPRQRGRHRHRPAGRRPQQRPRRPRQGRGAAAALGAGRRRALRAGLAGSRP